MGLNLNNVYQRPYVAPDRRNQVKKRQEDEQATSNAQKEQQADQNSKSKGLQYTEQSQQPQRAYQATQNNIAYQQYQAVNTPQQEITYPNEVATALAQRNPNINIAQILKDFRNTAIAIGTPDELKEEVNGYIELIEKQVVKEKPNSKLIKSNLKNAASILDNFISKTLNKDSKVVENWVDALFLQQIDFKYNENDINAQFLVKFPEETKKEEAKKVEEPVNPQIPQDKELKKLFIKAKKLSYASKPKEAILAFQSALTRANEVEDKETQSKIFLEVGKIYDEHDYLAQALKSYNESVQRTKDCNVKTRAHYSMAEIYNDVNKIEPAIDHYFSTVSFAGEAENLSVQSKSLAKIGNIYTDMYEKEAFNYFEVADSLADETENSKLKGYVSASLGDAHDKFGESPAALKAYSKAVKNYIDADSPLKVAENYYNAAEIMLEFKNEDKARGLLEKAQKYAQKTNNEELLTEINNSLISIS